MSMRQGILGALFIVASVGCYPPLPEPPPPESDHRWCIFADPAKGWRVDEQQLEFITDPMTGLWMSSCTCFCADDHAVMVAGNNGTLVPGSDAQTFYEDQIAILRTAAQIACLERVNALQMELGTTLDFDIPGTITCSDAVADEQPQYSSECDLGEGECRGGGTAGIETEGPPTSDSGESTAGDRTSADATTVGDTTSADATTAADATGEGSGTDSSGAVIDEVRPR